MKKKKFLFITGMSFVLVLNACTDPTVTFTVPQPFSEASMPSFPDSILGNYLNYDNGEELMLLTDKIIVKRILHDTVNSRELTHDETHHHDSLYTELENIEHDTNKAGDTLFTKYKYNDTIFNISSSGILKAMNGNYFLNNQLDSNEWRVIKMVYKDGVINIADIVTENEIKMMENITGINKDSTALRLTVNPSKEQLMQFLEQNGFIQGETFLRVNVD